jgi:hypothetical protein
VKVIGGSVYASTDGGVMWLDEHLVQEVVS